MYPRITKDIGKAVAAVTEGRIVAFPTGTSYGLAADALQGWALQRVRNLKQRPQEKTFTIFLKEALWERYLDLTAEEESLLKKMADKPLTLLVKPKESVAHLAQEGRVGLRAIDHPLMRQLAEAVETPLTATSANISDKDPCFSPQEVQQMFPAIQTGEHAIYGDLGPAGPTTYDLSLAYILNGGTLPQTKPTTIAKLVDGKTEIIRQGELKLS